MQDARAVLEILLLFLLAQDPIFRSDIALVRVDAEVRTETAEVRDLSAGSFRIFDNGRSQKIVYFAHEEQPLDVILLFDASSSMRPAVARVADAAHMALGELREGDRAALMAFDNNTDLVSEFTGDFAAIENRIAEDVLKRRFRCCTPIQGALVDAARAFSQRARDTARRAIVIVTDDQGTRANPNALRELWDADAVVLGVIVPSAPQHVTAGFVYMGMRDIAFKTGGDSLNTDDAAQGLHETIHRLRQRYSLYYLMPPAAAGEERKVQVQLTREAAGQHPGAFVRARTGYVTPQGRAR